MRTETKLPSMRTACLALGLKQVIAHFSGRSDDLSLESIIGIPFTAYPEDNEHIQDCDEYDMENPDDRYRHAIWEHMKYSVSVHSDHQVTPCHLTGQLVFELHTGECTAQSHQSDPWESDDLPF